MSDDSEPPDVRITVPRDPSDSDDDSYLRSGPRIQTPDYLVVVPVTGTLLDSYPGINVRRVLRTAVALAADNDGRVLLIGIETVRDASALEPVREYVQSEEPAVSDKPDVVEAIEERQSQLADIADVAQELDPSVSVTASVRAVSDITSGVLGVVNGGNETAVLLLRGAGLDEGWLLNRSTIDTILADAECDVFVENMGTEGGENTLYVPDVEGHTVASLAESEAETIDSILLPVGAGPHAALAAEAARAVARHANASVTVLHVVSSDASAEATADGEDLLKFADYVLGSDVTTETKETELKTVSDTADVIMQQAREYDFVSIGAPEQKSRLKKMFQSVQETVSEINEVTVLMSRDSDRTARSLYYRWKRGIEAPEDDGNAKN
jgi:nucleotide-binding universal stress UspA family protein